MGVEPSFYPESIEDWWRLMYLMLTMDTPNDCDDSTGLSQSFVAAFGPTDRDDRSTRARKATEQRTVLGWTRYFLTEETFTANQLPLPGWRRWLPLLRVAPNMRDELARRVLPGYQNRLDARNRRERSAWLQRHTGARKARFGAVESLAR
jgi:hypothetical protein